MTIGRDAVDTDVEGRTPHDSAVSTTRPNLSGLEARTTNPTAVADGDVVRAMADDLGRTITWSSAPRDRLTTHYASCSVSTTMTLALDAGASVFRDIVMFVVGNPDDTAETSIQIYDDTTTGTVAFSFDVLPNTTSPQFTFNPPFPAAAAATGWGIESEILAATGTMLCADSV